ncbi:MAG: hypothetical protein LBV68_07920 [Spirochaetaceae bacterium]|jgi:hypothetical protein|nr:hypothetical protein [Spirochaetaceae bacterium]
MKKRLSCIISVLFLSALSIGCSARISGTLNAAGRADLSINAGLGPKASAMMSRILSGTGASQSVLLDAQMLNTSLSRLPGIEKALFINKTADSIEGELVITKIDELISKSSGTAGPASQFVSWEQKGHGGKTVFYLDKTNGPKLIALLSPELSSYLSSIMAPLVTGEELMKKEYLDLISAVYGGAIAQEIAASRIKVSLKFPAKISGIKGGVYKDNTAEFDISLLDILVVETPLSYEIVWGEP